MPLFEYRCDKCGHIFSLLVGVVAERAKLRCPRCRFTKATKLISRIAPIVRDDSADDMDFDEEENGIDEDFDDFDEG